ncbi:MAG: PIN domain-containing protein [Chthoniobacterales bacterium]|nr:PIN domain-containing protein [Chthoniobacterales bacterium]
MNVYADTSWWFAYKRREDPHHDDAVGLFDRVPAAVVLWTPWQRVEVFNIFRQAEYRKLIPADAARDMIRTLQYEVQFGYWVHVEFSWTDAVRAACELGAAESLHRPVRGMDLFHVAIAIEVAADAFLSFDDDQNALARAAGFEVLYEKKKRK